MDFCPFGGDSTPLRMHVLDSFQLKNNDQICIIKIHLKNTTLTKKKENGLEQGDTGL